MNDTNDPYVWPTIEDFAEYAGCTVDESVRLIWAMARLTMSKLRALQATSKPATEAERSEGGAA